MKYLKKIIKSLLFTIILFLILSLIVTALNYFDIINHSITNILKFIIPLLAVLSGGFIMGKNALKNGWFEGLKFGLIISFLSLITILLLKDFKIEVLTFELILISSSTLGSMIGINKKKKYN